jgi:hypothetical protein
MHTLLRSGYKGEARTSGRQEGDKGETGGRQEGDRTGTGMGDKVIVSVSVFVSLSVCVLVCPVSLLSPSCPPPVSLLPASVVASASVCVLVCVSGCGCGCGGGRVGGDAAKKTLAPRPFGCAPSGGHALMLAVLVPTSSGRLARRGVLRARLKRALARGWIRKKHSTQTRWSLECPLYCTPRCHWSALSHWSAPCHWSALWVTPVSGMPDTLCDTAGCQTHHYIQCVRRPSNVLVCSNILLQFWP